MDFLFSSLLCATASAVSAPATYTNPVLSLDFPDPAVVRLPDGTFAAFATGGTGGSETHIQCATSPDLVTWLVQPDALPILPAWACQDCHRSVAPDVQHHNGTYYMYFSAYSATNIKTNCIGVATSLTATGPYLGEATSIVCDGTGGTAMDPQSYDHDDGTIYLSYGSHHKPVMLAELESSRLCLKKTGLLGPKPLPILYPDSSSYGNLVDAPWIYKDAAGALTMFYSGSQCCGTNAHYAMMAARSTTGHPTGPWEKLGGPTGNAAVVLQSDAAKVHVTAPGHNAVVRDDAGVDWVLYHANVGGQCNASYCERRLFLDRLFYNSTFNGTTTWPWIDGPSYEEREAPLIAQRRMQVV